MGTTSLLATERNTGVPGSALPWITGSDDRDAAGQTLPWLKPAARPDKSSTTGWSH